MRIAIDARAYFQRTGIARYTRELVRALVEADKDDEFLLLISDRHRPEDIDYRDERIDVRVSKAGWLDGRAERTQIGREVRAWRADVLHSIFPPLAVRGVPSLVTVFDLTPLSHPQLHQATVVNAFRAAIRPAVANASLVVTLSHAAAAETRRRFPRTAAQIHVAGAGLSTPFLADAALRSARSGVLFVGTIEPRKNVPVVVDTARALRFRGYRGPIDIVGKPGWGGFDVDRAIAGLNGVYYRGFVDDRMLRKLYRRAQFFLYPSSAEGFGLPVLEAMSQGALPLVSSAPALREVVGDQRFVVDIENPAAIAETILDWSAQPAGHIYKVRTALAHRARRHTWQRAARQILRLYKEVSRLSGGGRFLIDDPREGVICHVGE